MHPRASRLLIMSIVAVLALSACGEGTAGPSPAATVGSTRITDDQVAKEAKLFTFIAGLSQQPCGDVSTGISAEVACNRFALSNLIQGVLVRAYAAERQLTVDQQDIAALVASLDTQAGKDVVDQGLSAQGLTRDDLSALAQQLLLSQRVQQQLGEDELGVAKLRALYQEQILDFTNVAVDHILVKTRARAGQIYEQVTHPGFTEAQFKALAKQTSTDPSAKQNSGSYPMAAASGYVKPFAEAAVALEPGQTSHPVRSKFGWHVIRSVDKKVTPFEEAKPSIKLPQSAVSFEGWLRGQAGDQGVEVNPRWGTYDLESLSVVAVNSTDPSATGSASADAAASVPPTP